MDHAEHTPQAPSAQHHPIQDATGTQPEHIHVLEPGSLAGDSSGTGARGRGSQTSSTQPLHEGQAQSQPQSHSHSNLLADFERVPPPPPARSRDGHGHVRVASRPRGSTAGLPLPGRNTSGLDWIVPLDEKNHSRCATISERLQPTIDHASRERDKYAGKALWTGYALNIAIGMQVFLGALTTGIAAALTTGKQAQVSTAILGGFSTMVASYMARARGSGEPELSITRVKDLEQFLRESRAFQLDHGHEYGTPENGLDFRLDDYRRRFEELLGNASGERKLSPVGISATQAA